MRRLQHEPCLVRLQLFLRRSGNSTRQGAMQASLHGRDWCLGILALEMRVRLVVARNFHLKNLDPAAYGSALY